MEKKSIKVSIITATYNSESTIESCVKSVLEQSYSNIEYIIIDGDSQDDSVQVIARVFKEYEYSDSCIVSERDKGIYDALNKGIKIATGDIVGFLHSDDFFSDNCVIAKIVDEFKKDDDLDGVFGDLEYVNKYNVEKTIRKWKGRDFDSRLLNFGWMPAHPTLFLRKEVYLNYGFFDLSFKISADYEFILRIFNKSMLRTRYLPIVMTKMRVGGASNGSLNNVFKKSYEDYMALKLNGISFPWLTVFLKNVSKIPQFFIN